MEKTKKSIRRIFWMYVTLFAVVIVYLLKFMIFDGKDIITNSYNPRLSLLDKSIIRGEILDRNGSVLAETVTDDVRERVYPYGETFAHVAGYAVLGRSGVESKYNFDMQKLHMGTVQRIEGIFTGEEPKGNSAVLTLDAELQLFCKEKLGKNKGAIVAMEPSTGKILAMVSYPAFDPNNITDEWDDLKDDRDNSPLLNRAAQGLYPPGSVFKIVTAAAQLRCMESYSDFQYECKGEDIFDGSRLRCFNNTAHGTVDIKSAFASSCNLYFAAAGLVVGGSNLNETASRLYFNAPYNFPLVYSKSSFVLDQNSGVSEIVETSIGQGKTTTAPLHVAMIASAVANGGIMMEPYILDHMEAYNGSVKGKAMPRMLAQPFTPDEARVLAELMTGAVATGTGMRASVEGIAVAGKTGTAQTPTGKDHGWFVAFAPAERPQITVCVLLENFGGSGGTLPIAKDIIEFYLK